MYDILIYLLPIQLQSIIKRSNIVYYGFLLFAALPMLITHELCKSHFPIQMKTIENVPKKRYLKVGGSNRQLVLVLVNYLVYGHL